MNIRAVGPWIVVKVRPPKRTTSAGLYLPEGNLQERLGHLVGTVLSVGNGAMGKKGRTPIGISCGQEVMFRGYLKDINVPSYDYLDVCLVHEKDIIGVTYDYLDVCGVTDAASA